MNGNLSKQGQSVEWLVELCSGFTAVVCLSWKRWPKHIPASSSRAEQGV